MSKLLHAGLRRYLRSISFWLALAATAAVAVMNGYNCRNYGFEDFFIILQLIIFALLIAWQVGRELGEGIIRNKLVCGHRKGTIFLSEALLAQGACAVMFVLHAAIFALMNSYVFTWGETDTLLRMLLGHLLIGLCIVSVLTVAACLIPHRAIVAAASILLVLGIAMAGYALDDALSQPEKITEYEVIENRREDEQGNVFIEHTMGDSYEIDNPKYVPEPWRGLLRGVLRVLPYGPEMDYREIMSSWFGGHNTEVSFGYTPELEEAEERFVLTDELLRAVDLDLLCSAGMVILINAAGWWVFRRRQFK